MSKRNYSQACSLAFALDLIGDDTEETIDLILERNPTLIDINAVPIGFELSIPVTA